MNPIDQFDYFAIEIVLIFLKIESEVLQRSEPSSFGDLAFLIRKKNLQSKIFLSFTF